MAINTPQNIIVHHSASPVGVSPSAAEHSFNEYHKSEGFPVSQSGWYIGYHSVIYGNGEIRKYREDDEEGAHTKQDDMNRKSLGICLSGNFDTETPTDAQKSSLRTYLDEKMAKYGIHVDHIYPHRHFADYKTCYGSSLSDTWARELVLDPPSPFNQFHHIFQIDMVKGQQRHEIGYLQYALLIDSPESKINILESANEIYGDTTQKAVLAYQRKYKVASFWELLIVGGARVGPKTRAQLNKQFS